MEGEPLAGGNIGAVVRHGDVVHRVAGPWTPAVHHLLRFLERAGFPAPRVLDRRGDVERLTFVQGQVVHPDNWVLLREPTALAAVFAMIRRLHDLLATYEPLPAATWRDLGADPSPAHEIICHNDLGPYNLVHTGDGWVFIDWDLAAPGRRSWDVSWALQTLVPLQPDFGLSDQEIGARLRVALTAYGMRPERWDSMLAGVVERTALAEQRIVEGAARLEQPWLSLRDSGHDQLWRRATAHARDRRDTWLAAALHGREEHGA